jgi:hypothetical protein
MRYVTADTWRSGCRVPAVRIFLRFVLLVLLAVVSIAAEARPSIRVQPGGWGNASTQDIETVLTSVADVLIPQFPNHASARIAVAFSGSGPRVLAEKTSDGAYQVLLNVRGARWDQFAYQFSHELCHIVTNFEHREIGAPGSRSHQWFEETVCEVVSLVALNRLAARWNESPPHAGWSDYASAFRRYAERLLASDHRVISPATSMAMWYRENQRSLESDPYLREKNEAAATVLLRLFEADPDNLAAIAYMNETRERGSFAAYLASWYDCCPEPQRSLVRQLIAVFAQS